MTVGFYFRNTVAYKGSATLYAIVHLVVFSGYYGRCFVLFGGQSYGIKKTVIR